MRSELSFDIIREIHFIHLSVPGQRGPSLKKVGPPAPQSFGFSILPKKTSQERLFEAKEFLKTGKEEIRKGRSIANKTLVREGCEKVFHALVEASAARIQKLGIGVPENHEEIREGLYMAGPQELLSIWDDAFLSLHVLSYYRGWLDYGRIEKSVKDVENAIEIIEKSVGK